MTSCWYSDIDGLAPEHASCLADLGAHRVATLRPADLAPIPSLTAIQVIDAAKRASGDNFTGLSDAAVIERLNAGVTTALVREVQQRGLVLVEGDNVIADVATSLAATRHRRAGKPLRSTFKGRAVADLSSLVFVVEYSPRTGAALEDGEDPDEGTDWSTQDENDLRVLAWASFHPNQEARAKRRVLERRSDAEVIAAMDERKEWWLRIVAAAPTGAALRNFSEPVLRCGAVGQPEQSAPPVASLAQVDLSGSSESVLYRLLLVLFDANELRRFLADFEYGLEHKIPSGGSPADLAFEAAQVLRRHGLVDRDLFGRLRAVRRSRIADIDAVERRCLGGAS